MYIGPFAEYDSRNLTVKLPGYIAVAFPCQSTTGGTKKVAKTVSNLFGELFKRKHRLSFQNGVWF